MKPSEIILNNLDKSFTELEDLTGIPREEILRIIRYYIESLKLDDVIAYTIKPGWYRLYKTRNQNDDGIKRCKVIGDYDEFIMVISDKGVRTCILKVDLVIKEYRLIKED